MASTLPGYIKRRICDDWGCTLPFCLRLWKAPPRAALQGKSNRLFPSREWSPIRGRSLHRFLLSVVATICFVVGVRSFSCVSVKAFIPTVNASHYRNLYHLCSCGHCFDRGRASAEMIRKSKTVTRRLPFQHQSRQISATSAAQFLELMPKATIKCRSF